MSASNKGKIMVKALKIFGWTLFSVIVAVSVLLFCAIKFLDSKRLSPFIERIADDHIDGEVKLDDIRIGFHPRFPILDVKIKNLSVISHAFDSLAIEDRGLLPNYADSLLKLDYMSGSLDIKRLLVNKELSLRDVVLRGLSVNLVIAHNGKANYEVMKTPPDTVKSKKSKMSGFRINRFALEQPKEIRFYNAADSTSASVLLLTDAAVESDKEPTYRLKINGNVTSPKASLLTNLQQIDFGLNGKVYWDSNQPGLVAMDEMELRSAFIKAIVTGEIDFSNVPIVRKGIVELFPITVSDLLAALPDSIRHEYDLYEPNFSTDLSIGGRFELVKPMDLTTDTIPTAIVRLNIPPSKLQYEEAKFEDISLEATIKTLTNCPDSTIIDISQFTVAGPATKLNANATLYTLFSDPSFIASLQGQINLANLPPIIRERIPGYISGTVSTDLQTKGSSSMFKPEHIHRLIADGNVIADDVYFLSADTNKMVEINKARIDLNSKQIIDGNPILNAKLDVDTATVLVGGVDIAVGSLSLGAGVEPNSHNADTTRLFPIGGKLEVNRLNIISITDSAGGRIRNLEGHVSLHRFKNNSNIFNILADLHTGQVTAGSLSDRILLNETNINATLHKLPSVHKKKKVGRKTVNSHKKYSYIPPESVFKYVYAKRHHKPGQKRTRRVYGAQAANDDEVLVWNLAKGFSKFLNEWKLNGSVTSHNARLLTPLFPLRNRFTNLDVKFNNDTVNISDIALRVGKSDIVLSGLVTNVRRALTAKTENTLKVNLSLLSDTIDINQLSVGAFTGAAYAERRRHGNNHIIETADDAALEAHLDALAKAGPGKSSPFLIPVNVEAKLDIGANIVLYSDLMLQNMGGELLVYDGGVNLHQMKANSDAGNLTLSALYSAPNPDNMHIGFGLELTDFNIGKFVKLVPAIDSIMPLVHDFSGTIGADIAATCRIDSGMNLMLPTLNAAIKIDGDNLAFIDPKKYRTLGKWLGFKNKTDNTIKHMNVEMTVDDGFMRVYPFVLNIDRYRLGIYGSNDIAMNFNYHISVLKSPLPFKFGITLSGDPKKYKVRFGGAKFKENTAIESVNVVNDARINLIDQIENVFRRGVQNSRFAKLQISRPIGFEAIDDPGLSAADSLQLINEGLIDASTQPGADIRHDKAKKKNKKKSKEESENDKDRPKKKRKRFLFF